jgi:hypothetical protein
MSTSDVATIALTGQQAERRRAVDQDVVDVRTGTGAVRLDGALEPRLARHDADQLDLAPARSMVAGTTHRSSMPSAGCTTSAIGTCSMSTS